jgi:hypothetical protein
MAILDFENVAQTVLLLGGIGGFQRGGTLANCVRHAVLRRTRADFYVEARIFSDEGPRDTGLTAL